MGEVRATSSAYRHSGIDRHEPRRRRQWAITVLATHRDLRRGWTRREKHRPRPPLLPELLPPKEASNAGESRPDGTRSQPGSAISPALTRIRSPERQRKIDQKRGRLRCHKRPSLGRKHPRRAPVSANRRLLGQLTESPLNSSALSKLGARTPRTSAP